MKGLKLSAIVIVIFLLMGHNTSLVSNSVSLPSTQDKNQQEQEHDPIVEKVDVTNIEVPVRVLFKGKPVTDLKIGDFSLYENKKKVKINGFYKKSKTLTITQPATGESQSPSLPEPRTFVLVFNVSKYNKHFEEAVNHLFKNILKPNDRLLVLANDKTRNFNNLQATDQIRTQLIADLKEEGAKAKRRLLEYITRVETFMKADDFRRRVNTRGKGQADKLIDFLKKYQITWNEYQQNYLIPRVDRFYYFARYLEKLKGQKWVLNFYQFEFFPRIRPGSRTLNKMRDIATELTNTNNATSVAQGRMLNTMLNQINSDQVLNKKFPNEEVSKLFYKVDATFHSFFIKTSNTAFIDDIDYKEVSSDVEQILKQITDVTGGRNITSSDLIKSLQTVSQVDDTYYVLTYVPANPNRSGKLKIKVKNKKYQVLYDDNFRADYINTYFSKLETKIQTPDVKITDFSFKRKILAFTIKNFLQRKVEGKLIGRMKVRIQVTDKNNKSLFDQSKLLTAQKKSLNISLPIFKSIKKGDYIFLLNVVDMLTGKEDNYHQDVIVKR